MKLGTRQKGVLSAMQRFKQWPSGWIWENRSTTIEILDSLVKHGLVEKKDVETPQGRPPRPAVYTLTDAGHAWGTWREQS
jgi:DNA-binding PadR family transcriptional regulator